MCVFALRAHPLCHFPHSTRTCRRRSRAGACTNSATKGGGFVRLVTSSQTVRYGTGGGGERQGVVVRSDCAASKACGYILCMFTGDHPIRIGRTCACVTCACHYVSLRMTMAKTTTTPPPPLLETMCWLERTRRGSNGRHERAHNFHHAGV